MAKRTRFRSWKGSECKEFLQEWRETRTSHRVRRQPSTPVQTIKDSKKIIDIRLRRVITRKLLTISHVSLADFYTCNLAKACRHYSNHKINSKTSIPIEDHKNSNSNQYQNTKTTSSKDKRQHCIRHSFEKGSEKGEKVKNPEGKWQQKPTLL